MKANDWKRVVRPLLSSPDWAFRRSLCYSTTLKWNVYGVLCESSGFDKDVFHLWRVAMPLFRPQNDMVLSFSQRLRSDRGTERFGVGEDDAISKAVRSVLNSPPTDDELLESYAAIPADPNIHVIETCAYSQLLLGRTADALATLRAVDPDGDDRPWYHEVVDRAGSMAALVAAGNVDEPLARLATWRSRTSANLGLSLKVSTSSG